MPLMMMCYAGADLNHDLEATAGESRRRLRHSKLQASRDAHCQVPGFPFPAHATRTRETKVKPADQMARKANV